MTWFVIGYGALSVVGSVFAFALFTVGGRG